LQTKLDALVVVVANVIVNTRLKHLNAVGLRQIIVLGFDRAEEALNCRIIKAVAIATHALSDAAQASLDRTAPCTANPDPSVRSVRRCTWIAKALPDAFTKPVRIQAALPCGVKRSRRCRGRILT
jgi:hypothetical protein